MGKLIAKTAVITLLAAIATLIIGFSLTALFSPATMSDFTANIGAYRASAYCQQTHYNRHKTLSNLDRLVQLSILAKKDGFVVKYAQILIEDEKFEQFAKSKDENQSADVKGGYVDYIYGNYSASLYRTKKYSEAFEAASQTAKTTYAKNNSFQYYVYEIAENKDKVRINEAVNYLENLFWYLTTEQGLTTQIRGAALDIVYLYNSIKDAENAAKWLQRLEELKF